MAINAGVLPGPPEGQGSVGERFGAIGFQRRRRKTGAVGNPVQHLANGVHTRMPGYPPELLTCPGGMQSRQVQQQLKQCVLGRDGAQPPGSR